MPVKIKTANLSSRCFALFWILVFIVLASCSYAPTDVAPPAATLTKTSAMYWPTDGWRTSTPEEQGMDGSKLARMLDAVQQQHLNLHSLLIIRHGYIVSETYHEPYRQDTRHELYSCTKSFISTLIGIAIDQGKIQGVDQRVMDFFQGHTFSNPDPRKDSLTLEDLLTMRSGLDWLEEDPVYLEMYRSKDWVKYVLDKPMVQSPGSLFNYCSGCSHVLSAIIRQAAGVNTLEYAEQNLFQPLGISHVVWNVDSSLTPIGGWGLQIAPRDMAKLGYLYLHGGMWDGQQIVSAQWVKTAAQQHTGTDGSFGYGYQWWIYTSHGAYTALGRYGQMIFVVPESDLIVVMTAALDGHDEEFRLIEQYIFPAVQNP
jgi:CubicO group peptidase (beta-lactamase class C family)